MTREEAWVRFAAGAVGHCVPGIAAEYADRLMEVFDKRFPQPDINKQFNQQIEKAGQWMEAMPCSDCHGTGLLGSSDTLQAYCNCTAGHLARRLPRKASGW